MSEIQEPTDREAATAWAKEKLNKSISDLGEANILDAAYVEGRVVWMLPFQMFIAEIRESVSVPPALWVIGGEVATDHLDVRLAETPREAARHFSLKWQMQAARPDADAAMADKAEILYSLVEADEVWV